MAATYLDATATGFATGVSAFTATKPTGLVVGGLMMAHLFSNNASATYTAPAGWVDPPNSPEAAIGCAVMCKIADAADVAAANFAFVRGTNTAGIGGVVLVAYSQAEKAVDFNGTSGTTTTLTLAQVTAAVANTTLVHVLMKMTATAGAFTAPAGPTVRVNGTATGTALPYAIADEIVAAGATGTRAWTYAGSSASRGSLLAVNPAPPWPLLTPTPRYY